MIQMISTQDGETMISLQKMFVLAMKLTVGIIPGTWWKTEQSAGADY